MDTEPNRGEEWGSADDKIIGRAVRWSLLAVLILGVVVAITVVSSRRPAPIAHTKITAVTAPATVVRPEEKVPTVGFTDITTSAGINFVHTSGAFGEKLLPETMGGGVAFFDANGDGSPDLLFVNSGPWHDHAVPE